MREGEKRYREQIKILELSRNNHYATPIQELLLDVDMQTHKIFSELNVSKMLEVFLKEGLINEDYFDYISFFQQKTKRHYFHFVLIIFYDTLQYKSALILFLVWHVSLLKIEVF